MSLGEESSSDNGLRNTLKTNGETLSDCPIPLLDVTALAENDSGSTYIVQETRSLEMKGLCGRDWAAVNRLEALLEKHLQGRFKSEGDELPSLSLSFWREGNICSQGAVEGILLLIMLVDSLKSLAQSYLRWKWLHILEMEAPTLFPSDFGASGSFNKSKVLIKHFRLTSLIFLKRALIHPNLMLKTKATLTELMPLREATVTPTVSPDLYQH